MTIAGVIVRGDGAYISTDATEAGMITIESEVVEPKRLIVL